MPLEISKKGRGAIAPIPPLPWLTLVFPLYDSSAISHTVMSKMFPEIRKNWSPVAWPLSFTLQTLDKDAGWFMMKAWGSIRCLALFCLLNSGITILPDHLKKICRKAEEFYPLWEASHDDHREHSSSLQKHALNQLSSSPERFEPLHSPLNVNRELTLLRILFCFLSH